MNERADEGLYDDAVTYKPFDELRVNIVLRDDHSTDRSWMSSVRKTLPGVLIGHDVKGDVESIVIKTEQFGLSTGTLRTVITQLLADYMLAQPDRPEAPAIIVQQGHNVYRNEEALQHLGIEAKIVAHAKK